MKKIIASALLLTASLNSFASVTCLGEGAQTGRIYSLHIGTIGTMGGVDGGKITIKEKNGKEISYDIPSAEITQFYEGYRSETDTFVGLNAYTHGFYSFTAISYSGKNAYELLNFEKNETLESYLKDSNRKKLKGNSMTIPKIDKLDKHGLPQGSYEFKDVVCGLEMDV